MYNVHDVLKEHPVEVLQAISARDRLPYAIMLMNFEHDLNIGNCIRSAHLLGCESVIIFGKNKIDSRSTVGAHNYLNLIKVAVDMESTNSVRDAFIDVMEKMKLYPLYIDKVKGSADINAPYFENAVSKHHTPNIPCLVFGNEATGIHPETVLTNSAFFHIKQRGVIRSFNVASAASIVMYRTSQILENKNARF